MGYYSVLHSHKMAKLAIILCLLVVQKSYSAKLGKQILPSLGLFAVVEFPNDECTTALDANVKGICMNSDECTTRGGTSAGNCASGFGTCCRVNLAVCGGTVDQNITYVQNPEFPNGEATTVATTCEYTINPVASSPAVCQVRLDFDAFVLRQPNSAGLCNTDTITFTSPTGSNVALPRLCGTLTDQHMYIETGGQTPAATFTITTSAVLDNTRMWNIKVSQIPCHTTWKAPDDCLQYLTGRSGTFRGFNHPTGNIIEGQLYQICIRQEVGTCSIAYTPRQVNGNDAFQLNPTNTVAKGGRARRSANNCPRAHLQIGGDVGIVPPNGSGSIYCGGSLNSLNDQDVDGVVTSFRQPYCVHVYHASTTEDHSETIVSPTGDSGFSLQYTQLPCGQRFTPS